MHNKLITGTGITTKS